MTSPPPERTRHRVLIVGGGFAGLYAARNLRSDPEVAVTLLDRRNFHLFQPMLYQVATGALSPGDIAQPLRSVLAKQRNATVILGEAIGIDVDKREVEVSDGGPIAYDTLVVATGAHHTFFGHDEWAKHAQGLKTLEDALEMRRRVLVAFEKAEREQDRAEQRRLLTFVVIGGGPTGVELAGALAEISRHALAHDFREIDPESARVILIEGGAALLPSYPANLSAFARRALERLGVAVWTGSLVTNVKPGEVHVGDPRFDDWESVRDFEDVKDARAWREHLASAGFDAVLTADWPLDRFGRGDIALRVDTRTRRRNFCHERFGFRA